MTVRKYLNLVFLQVAGISAAVSVVDRVFADDPLVRDKKAASVETVASLTSQ